MAPRAALALAAVLVGRAQGLSRSQHRQPSQPAPFSDDCECLNWKNVYDRQAVYCGQAFEYMFSWELDIPWWAHEIAHRRDACVDFFEKMDDNVCVNTHQDHHAMARKARAIDGQWCYVPKECSVGRPTNGTSQVAWKLCGSEDTWSRNMTLEEVKDFASENDLDIAFTLKMVYPVMNAVAWDFAQTYWGLKGKEPPNTENANKEIIEKMVSRIKKKGTIMVVNSQDNNPPFGMVQGEKAWMIMPTAVEKRRRGSQELAHERSQLWCVAGCDLPSATQATNAVNATM